MKKRSYRLTVLCMAVLIAASLTGCNGSGGGGEKEEAEAKTKIVIERCVNTLNVADEEEAQIITDTINDYIADKINVEIELVEISGGDYQDKANLALANGEINLFWAASWMGAVSCDSLVQSNAVYDITDLLPGTALYDSMPESVWEASRYFGRDYFVPIYKEIAEGYDIMFRKDLIDKYGWDIESVKELKDLEPMLEDCVGDDTVTAPIHLQSNSMAIKFMIDQYDWIASNDMFGVDRETNEIVNVVATDEYRDFCRLMCEWGDKGYIIEEDATKSHPSTSTYSDTYWGMSWWTDVPTNDFVSVRYNQDIEIVHLTKNWIGSSTTLGSVYAIARSSTDEEAQACIDFLGLLYTDNVLGDLFTFGIEGTDYDFDEEGFVVKKGELYDHAAWATCSARTASPEIGEPANKAELVDEFNAEGEKSIALGFRLDKEPIEAELTACSNIYDQYGFVLECGGYPADEVDHIFEVYQAALDEAGYQKVLEEVSSQYEEWKETADNT